MRRLLFLLHGVGDHGAGWAERGPVAALREASGRYAAFRAVPLEERARLVPLSYDGLLDEAAARWRAEASEKARGLARKASWLAPAAEALAMGAEALAPWAGRLAALPGVGDLVGQLPALEEAWPSRVAHLAAWRADARCRSAVKAAVSVQVKAQLLPAAEDGQAVSAVLAAHSLGTAVAHDVLDAMGRRWQASRSPFSPARWRWGAVFMLADVSRLMATGPEDSLLRSGRGGWARRLYEVRHAWDPIDRAVPKADGRGARRLELAHAWAANVHSFAHYLRHPAVHVPLLRAACGPRTVTRAEEAAALAEAAARPSVLDSARDGFKSRLDAAAARVKGLLP